MARTFSTLQITLAEWLNRSDVSAATLGDLINIAMKVLERGQFMIDGYLCSHNFYGMEKRQTIESDETYIAFPERVKELKWVKVYDTDHYHDLEIKDPKVALAKYPYPSLTTGIPVMVSMIQAQEELLVRPCPDKEYTYDCCFYAFSEELTGTGHNYWTDYHWELLLYGACLQAMPYIGDDPRIAVWKDFYNTAVTALVKQERAAEVSGGFLRIDLGFPPELTGGGFDINNC